MFSSIVHDSLAHISPGYHALLGGVQGAASAALLADILHQRPQAPLCVITADMATARALATELSIFAPQARIALFPDWEILPYDAFSPHADLVAQRLSLLYSLIQEQQTTFSSDGSPKSPLAIFVPIHSLQHRIIPRSFFKGSFIFKEGAALSLPDLKIHLMDMGYQLVQQVYSAGDFAARGSLLDIFPMGTKRPIRIDFLSDTIDSIRFFDPETQRSDQPIPEIILLPAHEYSLHKDTIAMAQQKWAAHFEERTQKSPLYHNLSQGLSFPGIEYYLPLLFDRLEDFFAYLPKETLIISLEDKPQTLEKKSALFLKEVEHRYTQRLLNIDRPLLAPKELFLSTEDIFKHLKSFSNILIHSTLAPEKKGHWNLPLLPLPPLAMEHHPHAHTDNPQPFKALLAFRNNHPDCLVVICTSSLGRKERLHDLFYRHHVPSVFTQESLSALIAQKEGLDLDPFYVVLAPLEQGCYLSSPALLLITEPMLYDHILPAIGSTREKKNPASSHLAAEDLKDRIYSLAELQIGEALVHRDCGVGRYQGLVLLEHHGIASEYVHIQYADNDKLYVPIAQISVLSRYSAGSSTQHAPLHKLGGDHWEKIKKKSQERMHDVASKLLDIYAQRALHQGCAYTPHPMEEETFAQEFLFELTDDQSKAIADITQDLRQAKPMDRLICGDVGFGKTEVAMRAAFMAVQNGHQVAVLVPTTLLAQQHFDTFSDRMAKWPIRVAVLSRFKSRKEQQAVIEDLANGRVDIVIGTHLLLNPKISFKQLGLVIVDEEHRFGVMHKDQLKKMRNHSHFLTLTATPIPRTLHMAFSTLRDISIIASPPAKRLSIKTIVQEYHNDIITEAVTRELSRGGQIYYLHNNVETIEECVTKLKALFPHIHIQSAHGQMKERTLEKIMNDFSHQRIHILVCTTIIETGLDIPNANTLIIERADTFGLAQLHQIRGRVGRSHHQAYAYLLIPHEKTLRADAQKRLEAISTITELGSGFILATQDLEIRGAGTLLGDEQSGHMEEMGYHLYMELLQRTMRLLKKQAPSAQEDPSCLMQFSVSALIPNDYMPDIPSRLSFYKRLDNCQNEATINDLSIELRDRFGPLPKETLHLFEIKRLQLLAQQAHIEKIVSQGQETRFYFSSSIPQPISPERVGKMIQLVQSQPKKYRLIPPHQWVITAEEDPILRCRAFFDWLHKS